jgi:hypothetical protein
MNSMDMKKSMTEKSDWERRNTHLPCSAFLRSVDKSATQNHSWRNLRDRIPTADWENMHSFDVATFHYRCKKQTQRSANTMNLHWICQCWENPTLDNRWKVAFAVAFEDDSALAQRNVIHLLWYNHQIVK